jgi:hypothetical protein
MLGSGLEIRLCIWPGLPVSQSVVPRCLTRWGHRKRPLFGHLSHLSHLSHLI